MILYVLPLFSISLSLTHYYLNSSAFFVLFRPSGALLQVVNMQSILMLAVEIMMYLASVHIASAGM